MKNVRQVVRLSGLFLLLILLAAAAVGCGDDPNAPQANSNEPQKQRSEADLAAEAKNFNQPPPVQILSGDDTGISVSKPTAYLARNQKEMDALMKKHFSHGVEKQYVAETGFKTRQVVGVFTPTEPARSTLTVTDVYPTDDKKNFVVEATLLVPPKNCDIKGPKVKPFNVVETARLAGEPQLKVTTQEVSGC